MEKPSPPYPLPCLRCWLDPYQKIGELDDGYAPELLKYEEMFVSAYDPIGMGHDGTFQDSIVRFIFEVVNVRLGLEERCGCADGAEKLLDLGVCPHELAAKGIRRFGENLCIIRATEVRSSKLPLTASRYAFSALPPGNDEGRDKSVRIENNLHLSPVLKQ